MDDFDSEGHVEQSDNTCEGCYRWGRYPRAGVHQAHKWYRTCPSNCGHEHHVSNPDADEGIESDVA